MTYESALTSLADPTRRQIFEKLAAGPLSVAALSAGMPVSRPAVSQHLKVLHEAGLVSARSKGNSNIYCMERRGLAELRRYIDTFWYDVLGAFADKIEQGENDDTPGN